MPQPQASAPVRKEFDTRVHLRDKHGNLESEQHYAYHIIDGIQYFERPIGSGNLFEPNGSPCGRMTNRRTLEVDAAAAHEEYVLPPTGAEAVQIELDLARSESEALRKELAALKKERELAETIKDLEAKVEAKAAPAVTKAATPSKFAAHLKED